MWVQYMYTAELVHPFADSMCCTVPAFTFAVHGPHGCNIIYIWRIQCLLSNCDRAAVHSDLVQCWSESSTFGRISAVHRRWWHDSGADWRRSSACHSRYFTVNCSTLLYSCHYQKTLEDWPVSPVLSIWQLIPATELYCNFIMLKYLL